METQVARKVFRKTFGRRGIFLLARSIRRKNRIFDKTSWTGENSEEARFAKRLSLVAGMYEVLVEETCREEAFRTVGRIVVPIGVCEQWSNLKSISINNATGIDRLRMFYDFMGDYGSGQFVERIRTDNTKERMRFEVRNCFFVRFFREVGAPELATLFCKVDKAFFPTAIPEYIFSRGTSFMNTEAYGRDYCEFLFDKRTHFTGDCYISETPLLDFNHSAIQMLYEELDLAYKSDDIKMSRLYEYIRNNIVTTRIMKQRQPSSTILLKRRGDRISKAILYMALLRASGIPTRVRFIITNEGLQAWVVIHQDGNWIESRIWLNNLLGTSVGSGDIRENDLKAYDESVIEDLGVFDSPDVYFEVLRSLDIDNKKVAGGS